MLKPDFLDGPLEQARWCAGSDEGRLGLDPQHEQRQLQALLRDAERDTATAHGQDADEVEMLLVYPWQPPLLP